MTPLLTRLRELKALQDAATEGEWAVHDGFPEHIVPVDHRRKDAPELMAIFERTA